MVEVEDERKRGMKENLKPNWDQCSEKLILKCWGKFK